MSPGSVPDSAGPVAKLPRGRHGLSRDEVVRSQRNRIVVAMAEAMVARGYVGTTVAEILRRAGVSRETFYEQFRSKEDCFTAVYAEAAQLLLNRLADVGAGRSAADEPHRLEHLLGAYLDALAAEPAFARVFLVEVYAAGPDAIRRRVELQSTFADVIACTLDAHTDEQRFACQTLAAAVGAMVTARIAVGDLDGLRALREPLVQLVYRSGQLYGALEREPRE